MQNEFLVTDASSLLNRPLNDVTSNTRLSGLFHDGRESSISGGIRAAHFGGHHDFFDEFTDDLTFFQVSNFPFRLQPLASHRVEMLNHEWILLQLRNAECEIQQSVIVCGTS